MFASFGQRYYNLEKCSCNVCLVRMHVCACTDVCVHICVCVCTQLRLVFLVSWWEGEQLGTKQLSQSQTLDIPAVVHSSSPSRYPPTAPNPSSLVLCSEKLMQKNKLQMKMFPKPPMLAHIRTECVKNKNSFFLFVCFCCCFLRQVLFCDWTLVQ